MKEAKFDGVLELQRQVAGELLFFFPTSLRVALSLTSRSRFVLLLFVFCLDRCFLSRPLLWLRPPPPVLVKRVANHSQQVRVYQAHNDSSHTVGCDTEQFPTRDFIKANHERYKSPDDTHVMLPVQTGGGKCK